MDRIYFGIRMSAASSAVKELKRLQIELLPFEDPVATLLRSVPDDGSPQGRGYNIGRGGAVKPSFNSREFERSLGVAARDILCKKKPQGLGPCGSY
jgi:hypothetical protein